jgi:hypothetical protein
VLVLVFLVFYGDVFLDDFEFGSFLGGWAVGRIKPDFSCLCIYLSAIMGAGQDDVSVHETSATPN